MASNFKISTATRDAMTDASVDQLDGGRIEIRVGPPPTNLTDPSSDTLLGTCIFGTPAFDDSGSAGGNPDGQASANPITSDTDADNSGDAGYFRVYPAAAADTAAAWQGTAGELGDSPDMVFDNKSIVAGGTIAIQSMTFTTPIQ